MANILPSPPLFGLTTGRLIVATGAASVGNSGFTASGTTLDLAAAGTFNLATGTATALNIGGAGIGNSSFTLSTGSVLSFTGGLFIKGPVATVGTQLQNSALFRLVGAYWNGATSVSNSAEYGHVISSTTPTSYVYLAVSNSAPITQFQWTSAGAFNLGAGGTIGNTTQGATNTTALSITPNVADGASSIGLLIQSGTHLPNGKLVRISDVTTGALFDFQMDVVGNPQLKNSQINTYLTLSGNPVIQAASGFFLSGGDNTMNFGSAANRWSNVYTFAVSDGVNASITLNESSGSALTYAANTVGINAADILINIGGSGNLKMTPNKQFGVTAQAATNTTAMTIAPNVVDGATSIALAINSVTTLANAAARILSIQNNTTEYYGFFGSDARIRGLGNFTLESNGGGVVLQAVGQVGITMGTGNLSPNSDNAIALGGAGNRYWSNVYSWIFSNVVNNLQQANTIGVSLQNNTLATAIVNQYSPALEFLGQTWTGTVSQSTKWNMQLRGSTGNTNSFLTFRRAYNGVGAADIAAIGDVGGGLGAFYFGPLTSNDYIFGGNNTITGRTNGSQAFQATTTNFVINKQLSITGVTAGQDSIIIAGSGGGTLEINDTGGSPSVFKATSLVGAQQFNFQFANCGGFKFFGDATAGVGNRIVEIDGFANQTVAPLLVKLGATPGGNGDAIELQDSTGYQKWRADILGGMMLNANASTVGSQLQSAAAITFQQHYWSGVDTTYQITLQGVMDTVGPTAHLQLSLGGVTKYQWDQLGRFSTKAVTIQTNANTTTTGVLKVNDNNGNLRFGCDSQGLPSIGSYFHRCEDFGSVSTSYTTTGLVGSTAWYVVVSGGGLGVKYLNNTGAAADTTTVIGGGAYCDPSSTAGGNVFFGSNANVLLQQNTSSVAVWEWSAMFPAQTSNVKSYMGIIASNQFAHPQGFGFWWTGSGNWQWFTDNGTTLTITALSSPVAPTANRFQRFRIEFYGSASPIGVANGSVNTVKMYIDGTLVQTITGANVFLNSGGQTFAIGNNCLTTAAAPYLTLANWSVWYSLVTTPFSP